ncbi:COQ9-domain-containing protein [Metschnikowia bicuspidata var. bicuspidata NRRL YB-4993]|uniref:Ubiquinone biosynthesis protein n=1 Tax=Metschnikowia bicuspidata var. bicuspidata NRRL YB-4993 TaxID=869754 RepID=A0A1A0GYV0_9ASCO|nr:COQ9-domain-containing protein [Metschnikowia bicuspidata var. bicuspidata NRRL YB-4993]OBA16949.1 COQ9-domain-containing protein [Metschnikowia bicuspidata var. bicuspidata NRRL YB-4993]
MFSRTPGALRLCARAYHSISHPASNVIVHSKSPEAVLFSKAIEHVPRHGFSKTAIDAAVADLQFLDLIQSAISASLGRSMEFLFVLFWLKMQRQKLQDHVLDAGLPFHQIGDEYDRAAYLLNKRLLYNRPVIGQLLGALAQLVVPYNVALSLEELHNLSDDVAFYAGDMSNDTAWYAKRMLLSSIYVKSELFLLQDNSRDFERTRRFVDSSVASVRSMGSAYTSVEQWAVFNAISLVNLIKSQLARG